MSSFILLSFRNVVNGGCYVKVHFFACVVFFYVIRHNIK